MTRTAATFPPPVVEAQRWLANTPLPAGLPLLNVSQAAPVAPPPPELRAAMVDMIDDPTTHLYGPVLGNRDLRTALAAQISARYNGTVAETQIAITAGCNQAFAATIAALCDQNDAVILPTPWYFNHKMWLDMAGVRAVPLSVGADMLPDPDRAAQLITPRTRAITLVTPNNPVGVEYPPALIRAFADLARRHGIALILDETYRDFHSSDDAPHDLFTDPDWESVLVHLYSFSKAYRLTGHRVGAIAASAAILGEVEKFLDTTSICAPQLGQRAALWGIEHLQNWLAGERREILARRAALMANVPLLEQAGWRLHSAGAYFAWVSHPYDMPSDQLAPALLARAGILALPGTMFRPHPLDTAEQATSPAGGREMRIAVANIDQSQITELFQRLAAVEGLA